MTTLRCLVFILSHGMAGPPDPLSTWRKWLLCTRIFTTLLLLLSSIFFIKQLIAAHTSAKDSTCTCRTSSSSLLNTATIRMTSISMPSKNASQGCGALSLPDDDSLPSNCTASAFACTSVLLRAQAPLCAPAAGQPTAAVLRPDLRPASETPQMTFPQDCCAIAC